MASTFVKTNPSCRLSSASLRPPFMALRKALCGVSPGKPSKMESSPLHVTAKTQSASQSAALLQLSNAKSLAPRVDKRLAQHQHTRGLCKLVRSVRRTSAALSDTDMLFANKNQCSSPPHQCQTPTVPPLPQRQAGCRMACQLTFHTALRCQQVPTLCNLSRTIRSPWLRRRACLTHTLLPRSTSASLRRQSRARPLLSTARRRAS